ncbi:MAG: hypothetical protein R2715_20535 [Ilumatobacteraceae bacterium]
MADLDTTSDARRRQRLLAAKLTALVDGRVGGGQTDGGTSEPAAWPGGAALVREGVAWVLADEHPERALGPALAWARQQGASAVNVVAESGTGVLARRAACFADPPTVWRIEGRDLVPAVAASYPESSDVAPEHEQFAALIVAAGAVVNREFGVLTGEVAGLEVCRAVTDPHTGVQRLEVGVGAHDREAFQMIHGDVPTEDSLARIVEEVASYRARGAAPHPLNRLGAERRLRSALQAEPGLIGADHVRAVDPPVVRINLKDVVPCVAMAKRSDGSEFVVVCSVGVDLDVVPFAADARAALGHDDGELAIVVPARDSLGVTRALAAALIAPANVQGVDWPGGSV